MERAVDVGYNGVDLSQVQNNEELVGESFRNLFRKDQIERKNFYILSKLWGTNHSKEKLRLSFLKTLSNLKLDYLDCFLLHSPFGKLFFLFINYFIFYFFVFIFYFLFFYFLALKKTSKESDDIKRDFVSIHKTWREMEKLKNEGLVKSIGVCNFDIQIMHELLTEANIKPSINQIELHPYNTRKNLVDFCNEEFIKIYSQGILGNNSENLILNDPYIVSLSHKYFVTPSQIVLRWSTQNGFIVSPKSLENEKMVEYLNIFHFSLTKREISNISSLNKNLFLFDYNSMFGLPIN